MTFVSDASEEGEPSGVFWDPGSKGGRRSLVDVQGETSNRLFQVLEEWNAILQGASLYLNPLQIGS